MFFVVDPIQKKNDVFAFFYIFFWKSHILWKVLAYVKKKITHQIQTKFIFTEKVRFIG